MKCPLCNGDGTNPADSAWDISPYERSDDGYYCPLCGGSKAVSFLDWLKYLLGIGRAK